ncbi:unnamed protein product [Brachionus calyciflorus]|uniref:Uncharacterized protein n=1 Tax=Brachionus calyciflorus TaxID=104777 RepID=A0A813Z5A2_9BILA|nr:unnamed protein product [Brachionus calyciflorus]
MEEIESVLIRFISIFGSFEELLSDQSEEFCNQGSFYYKSYAIQTNVWASKELNELFDKTHPVVCDKVRLRQEKQNSAQSTTTEIIPIGSIVYLNFEGLLNKLEPRFKGPYTIKAHTKRCNYKVANALEEILPESFPLDKLKIVQQD